MRHSQGQPNQNPIVCWCVQGPHAQDKCLLVKTQQFIKQCSLPLPPTCQAHCSHLPQEAYVGFSQIVLWTGWFQLWQGVWNTGASRMELLLIGRFAVTLRHCSHAAQKWFLRPLPLPFVCGGCSCCGHSISTTWHQRVSGNIHRMLPFISVILNNL